MYYLSFFVLFFFLFRTKQEEIRIKRNSINHTVQLSEQNHTVPFFADGDTNKSMNETTLLEMDDFNSTISKLYPLKNESFDNIVSNFTLLLFHLRNSDESYFLFYMYRRGLLTRGPIQFTSIVTLLCGFMEHSSLQALY